MSDFQGSQDTVCAYKNTRGLNFIKFSSFN